MTTLGFDAKNYIEEDSEGDGARALHKVPVGTIMRSLSRAGIVFRVERSNGYVISGLSIYSNETLHVDLRTEDAEILWLASGNGQVMDVRAITWVARRLFEDAARFSDVVSRLQMVFVLGKNMATRYADIADEQLRAQGDYEDVLEDDLNMFYGC